MHFRYARHTDDLLPLITFYTEIIGLKVLGSFENHSQYDGVFLGDGKSDWHLEFTQSMDDANHHPDEDDLLVFYLDNEAERLHIVHLAKEAKISILKSKNPYWNQHGIVLLDPDGYGVVLALKGI